MVSWDTDPRYDTNIILTNFPTLHFGSLQTIHGRLSFRSRVILNKPIRRL